MACAGSGDDGAGDTTAPSADDASSSTTTAATTTETTTTTIPPLPEGSVAVPIEDRLVRRLPELPDAERTIVADPAFDERFCDGQKAPAVPEGQAEAIYQVGPDEVLTLAAYRFASGVAPDYVSLYTSALEACAQEVGEREDLGLVGVPAFVQRLTMEKGSVSIGVVLAADLLWVLFQQRTDGDAEVDPAHVGAFLDAVES